MPSENKISNPSSYADICNRNSIQTALNSTCAGTSRLQNLQTTSGQFQGYVGDFVQTAPTQTHTTIGTIQNGSNSTHNYNNYYRYSKDGEIRIDPETAISSIFLAEYNEWVECEVLELKSVKDNKGNKINIVSVTFEFSVSRLKKKQRERMVLTEKIKKPIELTFTANGTSTWITGINTILGSCGSAITIGSRNWEFNTNIVGTGINPTTITNPQNNLIYDDGKTYYNYNNHVVANTGINTIQSINLA